MVFDLTRGSAPLLLSMPHAGTDLPPGLTDRLSPAARLLPDTDWHVDRLYAFAAEMDISTIRPRYSRTVIDLNRDPDGTPLYPGANNTELCPSTLFDGSRIYIEGREPDRSEIEERKAAYYRPYHDALQAELDRLRTIHGEVALYDAHSIKSVLPRFFDGVLPDFNIGTARGTTADRELVEAAVRVCSNDAPRTCVVDGRFQGGYITRRYGNPAEGVHAIQMELAQRNYMVEEPPFAYEEDRAARLRGTLRRVLEALLEALRARKR